MTSPLPCNICQGDTAELYYTLSDIKYLYTWSKYTNLPHHCSTCIYTMYHVSRWHVVPHSTGTHMYTCNFTPAILIYIHDLQNACVIMYNVNMLPCTRSTYKNVIIYMIYMSTLIMYMIYKCMYYHVQDLHIKLLSFTWSTYKLIIMYMIYMINKLAA